MTAQKNNSPSLYQWEKISCDWVKNGAVFSPMIEDIGNKVFFPYKK